MSDHPLPEPTRAEILVATAVLDAAMVVGAIGLGWFLDLPWWQGLGPGFRGLAVGVVCGLVLVGFVWAFVHREGPLQPLRDAFRRDLREVFALLAPLQPGDLVAISLGAGVAEEVVFRGLIEAAGDAWTGQGALFAAVAFGLAHPLSRVYVAYAFAMGLVLSGVMAVGGGLFAAIVAHAVYDTVALLAGMRSPLIRPDTRVQHASGRTESARE
jgi:membrane protease YdiL (CAAX protease family)